MSLSDEILGGFGELATSQIGFAAYVTDSDGQRILDSNGDALIVCESPVSAIPVKVEAMWALEEGGARDVDSRAWTVAAADAIQFVEGQWVTDGTFRGYVTRISTDPANFLTTITVEQR